MAEKRSAMNVTPSGAGHPPALVYDPATDHYVECGWDEAFAEIEAKLAPIRDAGDSNATAVYLGNPNAHTLDGLVALRAAVTDAQRVLAEAQRALTEVATTLESDEA